MVEHINAIPEDLAGNAGQGRYVFVPGSDGVAAKLGQQFSDLQVKQHPRGHHLYLGQLTREGVTKDVAAVSTGMGSGSIDIVINELMRLGAKHFLRLGTAGSLQPDRVSIGDFVVATGAVRDESTSRCYVPVEYPAVASQRMLKAIAKAKEALGLTARVHEGIVHSKASLFAREFLEGPLREDHERYMKVLRQSHVLASEMETSQLFILSSVLAPDSHSGSILTIIGGGDDQFVEVELRNHYINEMIALGVETILQFEVED